MKKYYLLIALFFAAGSTFVQAQNVGIGPTSFSPDAHAMLHVSGDGLGLGILIPNMDEATRTGMTPDATDYGLLVYQTDGTANEQGYWYWDGTTWKRLFSGSSNAWEITGNSGTTAGANFIGTIDAVDWVIKTTNAERMRVHADGWVGINTSPVASTQLKVNNTTGIAVHASTSSGSSIYATNTSTGAGNIFGVYAYKSGNATGTAYAVYGLANGTAAINFGGYFSAGGGTNNYGVVVPASGGNSGFGIAAPTSKLYVQSAAADNIVATVIDQLDNDQIALDINASNTTVNAVDITADAVSTAKGIALSADGLTTGTALDITSTSAAGTAATTDYMLKIARSGANAGNGHNAYGVYATVANTNAISNTNYGGYFSATNGRSLAYGISASGTATGNGSAYGVYAIGTGTGSGTGYGSYNASMASTGSAYGSYSWAASSTGTSYGIYGDAAGSGTCYGVYGLGEGTLTNYAIYGTTHGYGSTTEYAVAGIADNSLDNGTTTTNYGGYFTADGTGLPAVTNSIAGYFRATGATNKIALRLGGSTSGTLDISPAATTTSYALIMPAAQGGAGTVLTNNGSGTLSWGSGGSGWLLTGNALTGASSSAPNEWIGSSNAYDWVIKTNNTERMRINSAGEVGINVLPSSGTQLRVDRTGTTATSYGIQGNNSATGTTAQYGVYGTKSGGIGAGNGYAVYGAASGAATRNYGGYFSSTGATGTGYGIFCSSTSACPTSYGARIELSNSSSDGYGVWSQNTSTGTSSQYGVYATKSGNQGTAVGFEYGYGVYGSASGTASLNHGVFGSATGATANYGGWFQTSGAGNQDVGVYAINSSSGSGGIQWGVYGSKTGNLGSGSGTGAGVWGYASGTGATNMGVVGIADGADDNRGVYAGTSSPNSRGAYIVNNNAAGGGTDMGIYVNKSGANATGSGYAIWAVANGAAVANYGLNVWASGGTNNYALYVNAGETKITDAGAAVPTRTTNGSIATSCPGGVWRFYIYTGGASRYITTSGAGDYSEYFRTKDTTLQIGEIVAVDNNLSNGVCRADKKRGDSNKIIGIVSQHGTRNNDDQDGLRALNKEYVNIGVLGQLPVRVSDENGPITPGDALTLSETTPGIAVKAKEGAGRIIGFAMTHYPYVKGEITYSDDAHSAGEKDKLTVPHVMAFIQATNADNGDSQKVEALEKKIEKLESAVQKLQQGSNSTVEAKNE